MKASIAHGVRPSVLILGADSREPWGEWDILLAKAYQRFLNELCGQCGMPKYMCHTDDNRIQFDTKRDHCASAAKAEQEQERMAKSDRKEYGVRVYGHPKLTQDAVADGLEFSDFRKPYLFDQAKKAGLVPENMEYPGF